MQSLDASFSVDKNVKVLPLDAIQRFSEDPTALALLPLEGNTNAIATVKTDVILRTAKKPLVSVESESKKKSVSHSGAVSVVKADAALPLATETPADELHYDEDAMVDVPTITAAPASKGKKLKTPAVAAPAELPQADNLSVKQRVTRGSSEASLLQCSVTNDRPSDEDRTLFNTAWRTLKSSVGWKTEWRRPGTTEELYVVPGGTQDSRLEVITSPAALHLPCSRGSHLTGDPFLRAQGQLPESPQGESLSAQQLVGGPRRSRGARMGLREGRQPQMLLLQGGRR